MKKLGVALMGGLLTVASFGGMAQAQQNLCADEFGDGDSVADCDIVGDATENGGDSPGHGGQAPPPPPNPNNNPR